MNTSLHSAGPWEYRGYPTPLGVVFDISQSAPGDVDVAYTYSHAANARLIASAPELLEALINLLAVHEGQGGTKFHAGNIARAAIAKATGGTT